MPSVCAFSMGAHIALELLNEQDFRSLILFYPAIYARQAYEVPFGDARFTEILRGDRSWASSDVLASLDRFEGNLLLVIGENDKVIPSEVVDLINLHAREPPASKLFE